MKNLSIERLERKTEIHLKNQFLNCWSRDSGEGRIVPGSCRHQLAWTNTQLPSVPPENPGCLMIHLHTPGLEICFIPYHGLINNMEKRLSWWPSKSQMGYWLVTWCLSCWCGGMKIIKGYFPYCLCGCPASSLCSEFIRSTETRRLYYVGKVRKHLFGQSKRKLWAYLRKRLDLLRLEPSGAAIIITTTITTTTTLLPLLLLLVPHTHHVISQLYVFGDIISFPSNCSFCLNPH